MLEARGYKFRPGGQVEDILDRMQPARNQHFVYDSQDRLIQASGPFGAGQSPATLGYEYDRYGNLRTKEGVTRTYGRSTIGLPAAAGPIPHAVTNVDGQSLTYDLAGNLTNYGTREYRWDSRGRLAKVIDASVVKAVYGYDYASRRARTVEGSTVRLFVTDDFEWDGSRATVHVLGAGRRLASLTFAYQPPGGVAFLRAPQLPDDPTDTLVASALGGPPLLLLLLLLGSARKRRTLNRRGVLAAATASVYWLALTAPMHAAQLDADADGLPDHEELRYGTDPQNPDHDGDGHGDGVEVAASSDPIDPVSVPAFSLIAEVGAGEAIPGRYTTLAPLAESSAADAPLHPLGYERSRAAATRDADGDGIGAAWDSNDNNALQTDPKLIDTDHDGIPNAFDDDDDGDGILDVDDLDNDNDGIPDAEELSRGMNPYFADTDGDGLLDAAELRLGTNPLVADTDGDGVPDGIDAAPLNPNTSTIIAADGDVAPLGARDGYVDLADALVAARIAKTPSLATAGDLEHGDVAPGGGDGRLDAADVLLLLRNAKGEDVDGDGLDASAEAAAGTSPFRADSDGDGLSDSEELSTSPGRPQTNAALRDSDGDGILDSDEILGTLGFMTDPNNPDTDGDGIIDSEDADPTTAIRYYHGDHLESSLAVTDARGDVVDRAIYKPFGEVVPAQGGAPAFGFTGQRFEASTSLLDYGARFYDPSLGRFLSADPIVWHPQSPQHLNRYSYVRNDPSSLVDPYGLTPIGIDFSPIAGTNNIILGGASRPNYFGSSLTYSFLDYLNPRSLDAQISSVTAFATFGFNLAPDMPALLGRAYIPSETVALIYQAMGLLDTYHQESLATRKYTGATLEIRDIGAHLTANGDVVDRGEQIIEVTDGRVRARRDTSTLILNKAPYISISFHIHEATGNRSHDKTNRFPSAWHDVPAAQGFGGRWLLVRGTDGRIVGVHTDNFGFLETLEFRGAVRESSKSSLWNF